MPNWSPSQSPTGNYPGINEFGTLDPELQARLYLEEDGGPIMMQKDSSIGIMRKGSSPNGENEMSGRAHNEDPSQDSELRIKGSELLAMAQPHIQ